jgi:hypothetical protein
LFFGFFLTQEEFLSKLLHHITSHHLGFSFNNASISSFSFWILLILFFACSVHTFFNLSNSNSNSSNSNSNFSFNFGFVFNLFAIAQFCVFSSSFISINLVNHSNCFSIFSQ